MGGIFFFFLKDMYCMYNFFLIAGPVTVKSIKGVVFFFFFPHHDLAIRRSQLGRLSPFCRFFFISLWEEWSRGRQEMKSAEECLKRSLNSNGGVQRAGSSKVTSSLFWGQGKSGRVWLHFFSALHRLQMSGWWNVLNGNVRHGTERWREMREKDVRAGVILWATCPTQLTFSEHTNRRVCLLLIQASQWSCEDSAIVSVSGWLSCFPFVYLLIHETLICLPHYFALGKRFFILTICVLMGRTMETMTTKQRTNKTNKTHINC